MPAVVQHSFFMTQRWLRALLRQPAWIVVTLVQPVMWLLLFGALFKSIVNLPGFGSRQLRRLPHARHRRDDGAVLGRLVGHGDPAGLRARDPRPLPRRRPSSRVALLAGPLVQQSIVTIVQSLIIIGLGLAVAGARFPGGVPGAR